MQYTSQIYPIGSLIDGKSLRDLFKSGVVELYCVHYNGRDLSDFNFDDIENSDTFAICITWGDEKNIQFLQLFTENKVAIYTKNTI